MQEIIDANLIIPWILWVVLQWALLLAPAVVLRKYLGHPMSKWNAIGTGVAMAVFWLVVGVMVADELGSAPGPRGTAVNAAPIAIAAWKMGPALAYGNTVVLKPSELTPATAHLLAEVLDKHLPKGVFNMVQGAGDVGAALSASKVDAISFTGSVPTGKKIALAAIKNMARVQCEMGSKNPIVITKNADIDLAVAQSVHGAFGASGQKCTASSRLIVEDTIHDEFVEKFVKASELKKVGHALAEGTELGPVVSEGQMNKILSYMDLAKSEGGTLLTGGGRAESEHEGYYLAPTVFTDTNNQMRVNKEEVFGPMTCIMRVNSYEEGLSLANDTEFGLACYFYSRDIGRIWRVGEALEYGIVGINEGIISNEMAPFGGVKESGQGREGSRYGMDDYLEIKYLCMGGIDK